MLVLVIIYITKNDSISNKKIIIKIIWSKIQGLIRKSKLRIVIRYIKC